MDKQVVLIFGPKKSGSSLFRQLLDGHSEGVVFPGEFSIKLFLKDRKYKNAFQAAGDYLISNMDPLKKGYYENLQGINKSDNNALKTDQISADILNQAPANLGEIVGLSEGELNNYFDKEAYHRSLQGLLKSELNSVNDFIPIEAKALCSGLKKDYNKLKFIGLKEVGGAGQDAKHLFDFMNQSLSAKIVFIVRDPRGVLLSRINSDKKHYKFSTSFKRKRVMMQTTALLYQDMQKLYQFYGEERIHIIRYEELVVKKTEVLQQVAAFLKIPFEDILETPSILGIPKNVTTSIKLVEKGAGKMKNQVFSDSVDKWKKGLTTFEKWLAESLNVNVLNTNFWEYGKTIPTPLSSFGYFFYSLRKKLMTLFR